MPEIIILIAGLINIVAAIVLINFWKRYGTNRKHLMNAAACLQQALYISGDATDAKIQRDIDQLIVDFHEEIEHLY